MVVRETPIKKKTKTTVHKPLRQPRICQGCGRNLKQKYRHYCTDCGKERKKQKKEDRELQKRLRDSLKTKDNILDFLFKQ